MSETAQGQVAELVPLKEIKGPAHLDKLKKRSPTLYDRALKIMSELYRATRANCSELPSKPSIAVYSFENCGTLMSEGVHAGGMQNNYFDCMLQFGSKQGCVLKLRYSWSDVAVPPFRIRDAVQKAVAATNSAYANLKVLPEDAKLSKDGRAEEVSRLVEEGVDSVGKEPPPPPMPASEVIERAPNQASSPRTFQASPFLAQKAPSEEEVAAVLAGKPKKFDKGKLTKEILEELSGKTQKEQIMILLWRLYGEGQVETQGALDAFEEAGVIPSRQVGSSLLSQLISVGYIVRIEKANRFRAGILEVPEDALERFRKSWLADPVTQSRQTTKKSLVAQEGDEGSTPKLPAKAFEPGESASQEAKLLALKSIRLIEIDEELDRIEKKREELRKERSRLFTEVSTLAKKALES